MERPQAVCLALVPFDAAHSDIWSQVVVEAFSQPPLSERYRCMRGESVFLAAPFLDPIHENIQQARIVVADVTHRDPSVMYCLGYARSLAKPMILLAQEGVPPLFPTAQTPTIPYPPQASDDDLSALAGALAQAVQNVPDAGHREQAAEVTEDLTSHDWNARHRAVEKLASTRSPSALPALFRALTDENWRVRAAAAIAIRETDDPDRVARLVTLLHDQRPYVRRQAAWTLREIGGDAVIGPLIAHLRDPSSVVREAVAWAFRELHDPRAVPALIEALGDGEAAVRRGALDALAEQMDRTSLPHVRALLGDLDATVRAAAARTLGAMQDTDSTPLLVKMLRDAGWPVRQAAARALGAMRAERAVAPLGGALLDAEEDVRWAAIAALAQIGSPEAEQFIAQAAQDETQPEIVRMTAQAALERRAPPDAASR